MSKIDYSEKVLTVENLKKYFYVGVGKNKLVVPAVDGVSFDIHKGEVLGLVGESGCGKTTTGRTIIKLYNPTDGRVTFNGVEIAAGFQTHLDNIEGIKAKLQEDIRLLQPNGKEIVELEQTNRIKIIGLEHELKELEYNHNINVRQIVKPNADYKDARYQAKNTYNLAVENVEYDINQRRKALLEKTINPSEVEYKKEVAMAKHAFNRSHDGLKDSAALDKEVIEERIEILKENYEKSLVELEEKFAPLIEEDEQKRLKKADIKEELKALKLEFKERKRKEKELYKFALQDIQPPDNALIKAELSKEKEQYRTEVNTRKEAIREIKAQIINETRRLESEVHLTAEDKAQLQEQIEKLKIQAEEDIQKERELIKEAKQINRSYESTEEITKMQMIFQDPISSLNPRMTVREIVSEGLVIQGVDSKEEIDRKVKETLELVGLSADFVARYPHEFSGGQRQRIGVARALIMKPDLIIADEPISALDVSIRAQVINLLTNLKDELGLTILFIAHDLSVVRFFCDRIAVMYYGKIVELAPGEDLFKNPLHPYTKSLLSAVPQPDPDYEKGRKRIFYDPRMHDYRFDRPTFRQIGEDHFVLANDAEFAEMKKQYKE